MEAKKLLDALDRIDCSYMISDEQKERMAIPEISYSIGNMLFNKLMNELRRHIRVNFVHDDQKRVTKYNISLVYFNPDKLEENEMKTFVDTAVGKDVGVEVTYDTETNKIVDIEYK